jgi:cytoskeletal protein RodZ
MATVAEQLREAREAQNLNVYQVAEITKIKTDHIRALESGTYDSFSAPVYIRGFVRTYAKALKLDVGKITDDLDAELSKTEKFAEPPPLMDREKNPVDFFMLQLSKVNWRILAPVGILIVLVVLMMAGVRACKSRKPAEEDPLKDLGPGLYQPKQTGDKLPVPAPAPAPTPPAKK